MTAQFHQLLAQFLSCGQGNLPTETEAIRLFRDPLFQAFRTENTNLAEEEAVAELKKQMKDATDRLLPKFRKRILMGGETALAVLKDLASQCRSVTDFTAVINLAIDSTYGHGRHACRWYNARLIQSWIPYNHSLLDIGSGNGWVGRELRKSGIFVRCFDNPGPYTRFWLHYWEQPELGWPSEVLTQALQDETAIPFLCFPHVGDPHTVQVVKKMKADRLIIFPGPDFHGPDTNAGQLIPVYAALRSRCYWAQTGLPDWYAADKSRCSDRLPILFKQDPAARRLGR